MDESNQIKKTNDAIIKESREAFKGQWGNVLVAFILSSLLSIAIGTCISVVLFIVYSILDFIFSYQIMGLLLILIILIGGLVSIIFQGRIWNWQNTYILKRSRGEDISNTDFKSVFEGISSVKDLKPFFLDKNNLQKTLSHLSQCYCPL